MRSKLLVVFLIAFCFLVLGGLLIFWKGPTGKNIKELRDSEGCLVGLIEIIVEDEPFAINYFFNTGDKKYILRVGSREEKILAQILSGVALRICGKIEGDEIQVKELRFVDEKKKARGLPLEDVTGEQRIAFILYNFQNNPIEPVSIAQAEEMMETVNQYYQEISYGKTWLNTDVFGYFTLQTNSAPCSYLSWQNRILENWGINEPKPYPTYIQDWREYDRVILASAVDACPWTGSATLGKIWDNSTNGPLFISTVWLDGPPGITMSTTSHELGHNHGVKHAGDFECGDVPYDPDVCSSVEYGDAYSVMGRSFLATSLHMDNVHKEKIGWLDENDILEIDRTKLGMHSLGAVHVSNPYPKAIKLPRVDRYGFPDGHYYLEYRRPLGIDQNVNPNLFEGIFVRVDKYVAGGGGGADVHLLDMSPHFSNVIDQVTDSHDPILKQGESYRLYRSDYVIYPISFYDLFSNVFISTIPCSDSDSDSLYPNGRNYFYGGTVYDGLFSGRDKCLSDSVIEPFGNEEMPSLEWGNELQRSPRIQIGRNFLEEFYCSGGVWRKEIVDCTSLGSQYICKNNACVIPGSCTDSDGGPVYTSNGTMIFEGKIGRDKCRADGLLGEYYCQSGRGGAYEIKNCSELGSDYICFEGECTNCFDEDGGINFRRFGIINQGGLTFQDYCVNDILIEYYCEDNVIKTVAQDCSLFNLDCINGECAAPE